ncbi:hypothetical protein ACTEMJ_09845, partial [Streptococcus pneumoniae]
SHNHLRGQYETNYDLNKYKITEELAQIDERFLGFHFIKSKRPIFSVGSGEPTIFLRFGLEIT